MTSTIVVHNNDPQAARPYMGGENKIPKHVMSDMYQGFAVIANCIT